MTYENVKHLDENNINLAQAFDRERSFLIVLTEEDERCIDTDKVIVRILLAESYEVTGPDISYIHDSDTVLYEKVCDGIYEAIEVFTDKLLEKCDE